MRKIAVATLISGRPRSREREAPVEEEEDDRRADEHQRVLDEARDTVGDELVDRLHVVCEAIDQLVADGVTSLVQNTLMLVGTAIILFFLDCVAWRSSRS